MFLCEKSAFVFYQKTIWFTTHKPERRWTVVCIDLSTAWASITCTSHIPDGIENRAYHALSSQFLLTQPESIWRTITCAFGRCCQEFASITSIEIYGWGVLGLYWSVALVVRGRRIPIEPFMNKLVIKILKKSVSWLSHLASGMRMENVIYPQ